MTDTTISGAVVAPIDEGIGSIADGNESWTSAAYFGALAQGTGYEFKLGLDLNDIDTGANEVDVGAGHAYVNVSGSQVQSTTGPGIDPPPYDTTLPEDVTLVLIVPSEVTNLAIADGATSDVWIALDTDGTGPGSAGDVYLRHGSGLSAPSHPSLKLGTADDSAGTVSQANEGPILGTSSDPIKKAFTEDLGVDKDEWFPAGNRTLLTSDGGFSWFMKMAAAGGGETYVGINRAGGDVAVVDGAGNETVLNSNFEADDHATPGILYRSDGKIMAFYSQHNGSDIRYRTSSSADDISSFGSETTITPGSSGEFTYMNPFQDSNGRIWLFYRAGDTLAYIYSDDNGSSWSTEQTLVSKSTYPVYFQFDFDGSSRFDIALSEAGASTDRHKDCRYVQFDSSSESALDASGSSLGSLPVAFNDAELVYDTDAAGNLDAWVWDVFQSGGEVAIVYATFDQQHIRTADTHYYRYARWNGSQWVDNRITEAGSWIEHDNEIHYSPGIALESLGRAYLALGDHEQSSIQRWRTQDDGQSWQWQPYYDAGMQNIRPTVPHNATSDLPVIWMNGRYDDFLGDFHTSVIHAEDAPGGPNRRPLRWGGCRKLYTGSGQSIAGDNSETTVEFDFLREDTRNETTKTGNTITVNQPGFYLIQASVGYTAFSAAGTVRSYIDVDPPAGRVRGEFQRRDVASGEAPVDNGSIVRWLSEDTTIKVITQQDSGSAQTTDGDNYFVTLSCYQIG